MSSKINLQSLEDESLEIVTSLSNSTLEAHSKTFLAKINSNSPTPTASSKSKSLRLFLSASAVGKKGSQARKPQMQKRVATSKNSAMKI